MKKKKIVNKNKITVTKTPTKKKSVTPNRLNRHKIQSICNRHETKTPYVRENKLCT